MYLSTLGGSKTTGRTVTATHPRTGKRCSVPERRYRPVEVAKSIEVARVPDRFLTQGARKRKEKLHRDALAAYIRLKRAAEQDGIRDPLLKIVSGLRPLARQKYLWEKHKRNHPNLTTKERRKRIAYPGRSVHGTGRAVDFYLGRRNRYADRKILARTPAHRWLVCNAARFGFYPYHREPWHWEYIGPATGAEPSGQPERSTIDVARAVERNRVWATRLGWGARREAIQRVLGFSDMTPAESAFAEAVARWQASRGLESDGIIGPKTWRKLRGSVPKASAAALPTRPSQTSPGAGPTGRLGVLTVSAPGFRAVQYRFTPEDALWTARFLVGEAGGRDDPDNRAVLWAMFNRYALLIRQSNRYRRDYPTFHSFLRAYSTPLQPCLKRRGAAARHYKKSSYVPCPGGGTYKRSNIPRGQLQKHLDLQRTPWSQLRPAARALAEAALGGRIPNPIGPATEFANTRIYFRQRHGRTPTVQQWKNYTRRFAAREKWEWIGPRPSLNQMRKNAFFVQKRLRNLPADAVRIIP